MRWGREHTFISLHATHYLYNFNARLHKTGSRCGIIFLATNIISLTVFPIRELGFLRWCSPVFKIGCFSYSNHLPFFLFLLKQFGYTCSKMLAGNLSYWMLSKAVCVCVRVCDALPAPTQIVNAKATDTTGLSWICRICCVPTY